MDATMKALDELRCALTGAVPDLKMCEHPSHLMLMLPSRGYVVWHEGTEKDGQPVFKLEGPGFPDHEGAVGVEEAVRLVRYLAAEEASS